jgi:hypothetical protein
VPRGHVGGFVYTQGTPPFSRLHPQLSIIAHKRLLSARSVQKRTRSLGRLLGHTHRRLTLPTTKTLVQRYQRYHGQIILARIGKRPLRGSSQSRGRRDFFFLSYLPSLLEERHERLHCIGRPRTGKYLPVRAGDGCLPEERWRPAPRLSACQQRPFATLCLIRFVPSVSSFLRLLFSTAGWQYSV